MARMNDGLKKLIRPHFLTLEGYVSAGMESAKDKNLVFMNANENPFTLPGLEGFNRYPEPQPKSLLEAYAKTYGVKPENIIATRGADEAIKILTQVFCEPGKDSILIHPPTFGIYKVYGGTMPVKIIEVPLIKANGGFALDVPGIIEKSKAAKLIHLCSPNNPTATSFPHADILKICKATEDRAVVVLDEAYAEFSKQGGLTGKLKDHPNLIIMRTLSKAYGLAGMRMGCALSGDPDFIALLKAKVMETYPLTRASVEAALKALSMPKEAKANIDKLLFERDRLRDNLAKSPLVTHIYPSDANFLLVEMKNAKEFCTFCKDNNVMLRDFSSRPGTENAIRISPGTPQENDLLVDLMKRFAEAERSSAAG
jgi:histidinol-phosphate aminotransferase